MTDKSTAPEPDSPPDMAQIRKDIDRVDNALLTLIAERLELAQAVRRAKSGVRVWRPSREEEHVRDLAKAAGDTSEALVSTIWAELMSASLALQGPMRLHIALEGDALTAWSLVRDRFGASIPTTSYPTTSSALAAAYSEGEGVAVLPAPGGMNSWWSALCADGAAAEMNILAGLPRTGNRGWPKAVAVATCARQPSGHDMTLIAASDSTAHGESLRAALTAADFIPTHRAEAGMMQLFSAEGFVEKTDARLSDLRKSFPDLKIIGVLPRPISAVNNGS